MAFSQWFKENEGLVNQVAGEIGQGQVQPVATSPQAQIGNVQPDDPRMQNDVGGESKAKKILSIVAGIYSGGISTAAQSATGK